MGSTKLAHVCCSLRKVSEKSFGHIFRRYLHYCEERKSDHMVSELVYSVMCVRAVFKLEFLQKKKTKRQQWFEVQETLVLFVGSGMGGLEHALYFDRLIYSDLFGFVRHTVRRIISQKFVGSYINLYVGRIVNEVYVGSDVKASGIWRDKFEVGSA